MKTFWIVLGLLIFLAVPTLIIAVSLHQSQDIYHLTCYQGGHSILDEIVTKEIGAGINARLYPSGNFVQLPVINNSVSCIWINISSDYAKSP